MKKINNINIGKDNNKIINKDNNFNFQTHKNKIIRQYHDFNYFINLKNLFLFTLCHLKSLEIVRE